MAVASYLWGFCLYVALVGLLHSSVGVTIDHPCQPTGKATMGPFFEPRQPEREVMCMRDPRFARMTKLIVSGIILDEYCKLPVPGAKVEVWQADSSGRYRDSSLCRSTRYSDCRGQYNFTTIHPGKYSSGFGFRPSHIHYMVTTPNSCYNTLVMQLYFEGDPNLGYGDSCSRFVCNSDDETLITTTSNYTVNGIQWTSAEFNIVLTRNRKWQASACTPQPCPSAITTDQTVGDSTTPPPTSESPTRSTTHPMVMMSTQPLSPEQLTTTPLLAGCPDVESSPRLYSFDYIFKITIKNKRITSDGYFRAKVITVYSIPDNYTSFDKGEMVPLKCLEDCHEVCNTTLISRQSFLLAGNKTELSDSGMIALNGTSLIRPWALVKKDVKKAYNSKKKQQHN